MNPESLSEQILSAYLDGECNPDERVAVEARLASDAEWQAILEEIRATRAVVRSLPRREPPLGFVDALIETPDAPTPSYDFEQPAADAADTSAPPRRGRRPRIIAAIAAAAAIAVGFLVASPTGRDTDVAPPIATLADSHGATLSLQSDPLSGIAPIAATSGLEP